MNENTYDFSALERELPAIVFRNWKRWGDFIPYSPRTLANEDCCGTGPRERIKVGHVVGYPRAALIAWLRERTKILPAKLK